MPSPVTAPSSLVSGSLKTPSLVSGSRLRPRRTMSMTSAVRRQRLGVGHAVEALDHLRAARAEAEDRAAAGHVVEPGRGLQQRAGSARVDVEDRRADLDRLGLGREVAHQRGGVEAVRLGDPDACRGRPSRARLTWSARCAGCRRTSGCGEAHAAIVTVELSRCKAVHGPRTGLLVGSGGPTCAAHSASLRSRPAMLAGKVDRALEIGVPP